MQKHCLISELQTKTGSQLLTPSGSQDSLLGGLQCCGPHNFDLDPDPRIRIGEKRIQINILIIFNYIYIIYVYKQIKFLIVFPLYFRFFATDPDPAK